MSTGHKERPRRRHGFHEQHPAKERLLLAILNGEHDPKHETTEQTAIINGWINALETDLGERKRHRRLPSERAARKAQRPLFRRKRL